MENDATSRFTKLRYDKGFTDVVVIGIQTKVEPVSEADRHLQEKMVLCHIQHLRPCNGILYPVGDMVECWNTDVFSVIHDAFQLGKSPLLVCNNSLVVLGASDFVQLLEEGKIKIAEGKVKAEDFDYSFDCTESTHTFIVSAPPTIVAYVRQSTKVKHVIVDIANYGLRYIDDIFDKLPEEERRILHGIEWKEFSTYDSIRSTALMARFMQEYFKACRHFHLGQATTTYAGQAMRAYRKNHYQGEIKTHDCKKAVALERACYTLGRNEVRFRGTYHGKCYLVDYNSLYPFLGATRTFPQELADYQDSPSLSTVEEWCKGHIVLMQARVRTDEAAYRAVYRDRVVYPSGEYNTCLSGDECVLAIRKGHVRHIYRAAKYVAGYCLRDYSRHMLGCRGIARTNGNAIAETIAKCITNGLWGRLGQHGSRWVIDDKVATHIRYGGFIKLNPVSREHDYYRVINGVASRLCHAERSDNTFPAIAAVANAYSRSMIWQAIKDAGQENVLYVGIDSLIVTRNGLQGLAEHLEQYPGQLGRLKIVTSGQSCLIKSVGIYSIGHKTAYAGMPRRDTHRTIGFWDRRSNVLPTVSTGCSVVTNHAHLSTPTETRERLSKPDKSPGSFIVQEPIYQEPLESHYQPPARVQPSFRFGEYGR